MNTIVKPESNLLYTDPWTISAVYINNSNVGDHLVTVTATLVNYPNIAEK